MTKDELLNYYNINIDLYNDECKKAKLFAPFIGKKSCNNDTFISQIAHDISFDLFDLDLKFNSIIELLFELYEDMPCYSYLMYLAMEFNQFSIDKQLLVIRKFHHYLKLDNDILSKPIEYSLWCDYFEDIEIGIKVWHGLLDIDKTNKIVIPKLLRVSGPIPFKLKDKLYKKIHKHVFFHQSIFDSIKFSLFDVYGNINKKKALKILMKLNIDKTTYEYQTVMENLLADGN